MGLTCSFSFTSCVLLWDLTLVLLRMSKGDFTHYLFVEVQQRAVRSV